MSKFKFASLVVAFALVLALVGGVSTASAQTSGTDVASLQALIASLQAQIAALTGGSAPVANASYTRDLTIGSRGDDVAALQSMLVSRGHLVMPAGVPMGYFGALTKSALAKYQASVGLPSTGYFGPLTRGQIASTGGTTVPPTTGGGTTVPPTTGGTGITTPGVEGTLTVTKNPTPSSGLTIREGQTQKGVLGLKIEAKNSDMAVQRVKLNLGTNTSIYTKVFSRVYLMDGNTVVAESALDSSTVFEEGSTKFVQLTGFNFLVPKNSTKVLTVAVDVRSTIDSGDQGSKTFTLPVDGVRALDGAGIDQKSPSSALSNSVTVDDSLVDSASLTVALSSQSPLPRQVVANDGSSDNDIDELEMAKFELKADGDDVTVNDWQVTVYKSGTNGASAATAYLYDGSTEIGSATITSGAATFEDIDYVVPEDVTKTLTLKVKITGADNTGIGNFGASTTGGAITAENGEGSSVTPSGTASTTAVAYVVDDGLEISLASAPTITKTGANTAEGATTTGTSTIQAVFSVRLKAVDAAVLVGGVASGTPAFASSSTGFKIYVNGAHDATVSSNATNTDYSVPSGKTLTTNTWTLNDGESVTIPVTYTLSGRKANSAILVAEGSTVAVQMAGIQWRSGAVSFAPTSNFMDTLSEWRTTSVTP